MKTQLIVTIPIVLNQFNRGFDGYGHVAKVVPTIPEIHGAYARDNFSDIERLRMARRHTAGRKSSRWENLRIHCKLWSHCINHPTQGRTISKCSYLPTVHVCGISGSSAGRVHSVVHQMWLTWEEIVIKKKKKKVNELIVFFMSIFSIMIPSDKIDKKRKIPLKPSTLKLVSISV